jgi:RHS repeat-associated protein
VYASNLSAKASAEADENATLVDVYFDDVTMTHTKGNVIQYNEYYPFGMQTANSWTRENTTANNFLANGGTELNTTSNLYDLAYRNYDPVLGRMNGVDPMAITYGSVSPYNYSFNDPVSLNDPSGADPYASYGDGFDPVLEQYTGYMYSSNYGWLQDDNIHHRIIGWTAPIARYAGTLALPQNQRGMEWAAGAGMGPGWRPGNNSLNVNFFNGTGLEKIFNPWAGSEISSGVYSGDWVYNNPELEQKIRDRGYDVQIRGGYQTQGGPGCPTCLDPSTLHKNLFGLSYPGGNNPRSYNGDYDYSYVPTSKAEYPAIGHDRRYDNLRAVGAKALLTDSRTIGADWRFVKEELRVAFNPGNRNEHEKLDAFLLGIGLGLVALPKTIVTLAHPSGGGLGYVNMWYDISNIGVTNTPSK